MGPRNRFQGMNSASLCSLAGRYDNPIPTRCLAPIDFLKIPARVSRYDHVLRSSSVCACLVEVRCGCAAHLRPAVPAGRSAHTAARLQLITLRPARNPQPDFVNVYAAQESIPPGWESIPGLLKRLTKYEICVYIRITSWL